MRCKFYGLKREQFRCECRIIRLNYKMHSLEAEYIAWKWIEILIKILSNKDINLKGNVLRSISPIFEGKYPRIIVTNFSDEQTME